MYRRMSDEREIEGYLPGVEARIGGGRYPLARGGGRLISHRLGWRVPNSLRPPG